MDPTAIFSYTPAPSTTMRPLEGTFKIQCNDEFTAPKYTDDLDILASAVTIQLAIEATCPGLKGFIDVSELKTYYYRANGRHLRIRFAKA